MEELNNNSNSQKESFDASMQQNCYCQQENTTFVENPDNKLEDTKFVRYKATPKTQYGLIVFVIMLSVVAVLSFLSILLTILMDMDENQDVLGSSVNTTTTQNTSVTTRPYDANRPELVISDTPDGEEYNAVEVAEKVTESMVSLLVYQNGDMTATGSGVIMTADGYIVTCAHVVNNVGDSLHYRVRLSDNREFDAQVIGFDNKTDIGILKVEAEGLKPAEFASSDTLKSGQDILAIGSPGGFDFAGSITDGIISSPNRYITKGDISNFRVIQHTAAINPGNSGGALVNMHGQVIGINSAKMVATDYEGMGFATSISYAKTVIDDIIQYGAVVRRARLGVEYLQFDHLSNYGHIVTENNLPPSSLVVVNVDKSSDLINYDVKSDDFLIGVNGKEMTGIDVLLDVVYSSLAGDTVTLKFFRPDTKEIFEVTCKFVGEN